MERALIDTAGHWLAPDAAASYRRMREAGMPAGGIASAGRTYAEQEALYRAYKAGRGNLAAHPGTSLHETGRALDVTRGTDAQLWLIGASGRVHPPRAGEVLPCHVYGWSRTVPSEGWHFAYDPAKDQHKPVSVRPTIRRGSSGQAVRDLQAALRARGVRGDLLNRVLVAVDGAFGARTERAVRRYQRARGLAADGVVGPRTWAALGL